MNIGKIKLTNNIKEADKLLKKYWKDKASNEKPIKPKFKIILISSEGKGADKGYIYAYDIDDGYFHICIISDIVTGTDEKLNKNVAVKLIRKLIDYCKRENIETISSNLNKEEMILFKKLNFEIRKGEGYADYFL